MARQVLLAGCVAYLVFAVHGYQYIGCFLDGGDRDLPYEAARGSMTVQKCNGLCTHKNYPYFGVQAGNECRCGNGFGRHGPKPTRECDHECSGDRSQLCGGGWRNSLYTSDFDFGMRFIGCYVDADNRDLPELVGQGGMSIAKCYSLCKQRKFAYFGAQNANECWCGNSYGKHGSRSTEECHMRCTGEGTELCGAAFRNSLYSTGVSPLHLPQTTDPMHPNLRDQLAVQIKSQYLAFPTDVMCTTCLVAAWSRRHVDVHSKVIPVKDLSSVLASYPEKVKQKVLPLQFTTDGRTTFEDFSHHISGNNAHRTTYLGVARRVKDNVELAMVAANLEAQLATNFNVYYHQNCYKILWIFTKCDTHRVQEIRGYSASEVNLIDKALQSEIFRLLGEKLSEVKV